MIFKCIYLLYNNPIFFYLQEYEIYSLWWYEFYVNFKYYLNEILEIY